MPCICRPYRSIAEDRGLSDAGSRTNGTLWKIEIMIRVYDTNALWRHDEILRIRHLEAEIADTQKEIDRRKQKKEA